MMAAATKRRPARVERAPRFCAEAVGAEAIEENLAHRSILGVPLDSGEIVILVCRRSWVIDAIGAALAAGVAIAIAWFASRGLGRPATPTSLALVGLAVGCGMFVIEHMRRLYVLTDRRVLREDRRLTRVALAEAPLPSVRGTRLVRNDVQSKLKVGTIVFRTDHGVIAWSSVGDAERVHEIVQQAVKRYGGSMRGM